MQDSTDEMYDVVVVGAGFGGMYLLRRLRDELGLRVRVVERGDTVGGTWYWNRYPGARCDAESIFYSYSFDSELQQTWTWSEKYATQPEILAYAEHVADRYELRRDIAFGVEVTGAAYDEARNMWTVHTSTGELTAKYFITAMGCLSASRIPDFDGLGEFNGTVVHTADWPREGVDLSGKRVAMIGTGSTGIQLLPQIAPQADRVTVFQRTANYSVPARNRRLGPDEYTRIRSVYRNLWEQARFSPGGQILASPAGSVLGLDRATAYSHLEQRWSEGGPGFIAAFTDTMLNENANDVSADFVRDRIREIVRQPETADLLCPTGYPIGSKRICVDTDYYETFNRDNVELVSIRETPIERITPDGVVVDGALYPADVIIFATGFDAITGPFTRLDIRGRGGRSLRDEWSAGPGTYLGLTVHGFPNMFMVTGPGSPSVLSNMIASIEQHVDWIADYLIFMANVGIVTTEATASAQESWVSEVNEVAHATLYVKGASWYLGANVPGKPRVFMPYAGGVGTYRQHCDLVAAKGYPGFSNTFRDFEPAQAAVTPTRSDGVGPDLASASHA